MKEAESTDYSKLKAGDVISVKGFDELVEIHHVTFRRGWGSGMGEHPDTWHFITNHGEFTFDPWAPVYRPYTVVKLAVKVELKRFDAVYLKKRS